MAAPRSARSSRSPRSQQRTASTRSRTTGRRTRVSHNTELSRERMQIDGFEVLVVRKAIRNMYMRIKPEGSVVISAPARMPMATIERFIHERRDWIQQALNKQRAARENLAREIGNRMQTSSFEGNLVPTVNSFDGNLKAPKNNVSRDANVQSDVNHVKQSQQHQQSQQQSQSQPKSLVSPTQFAWTQASLRTARASLERKVPALLAKWEPIIGKKPSSITLRTMTSRWGSCTPSTGRIRLNLQLGLMDDRLLEYVLVHELTHLWEHGHGAGFQRRMDQALPQWRQLRKVINTYAIMPNPTR